MPAKRLGRQTVRLSNPVSVVSYASIGGKLDAVPYSSNLLKAFGLDLTKATSKTSGLDASVSGSGAQVAGVQPQTSSLNVAAAMWDIDKSELARLRGNCIEEVKRINGTISFDDAVYWQQGDVDPGT
mgnify:CR=1 FL=1